MGHASHEPWYYPVEEDLRDDQTAFELAWRQADDAAGVARPVLWTTMAPLPWQAALKACCERCKTRHTRDALWYREQGTAVEQVCTACKHTETARR